MGANENVQGWRPSDCNATADGGAAAKNNALGRSDGVRVRLRMSGAGWGLRPVGLLFRRHSQRGPRGSDRSKPPRYDAAADRTPETRAVQRPRTRKENAVFALCYSSLRASIKTTSGPGFHPISVDFSEIQASFYST